MKKYELVTKLEYPLEGYIVFEKTDEIAIKPDNSPLMYVDKNQIALIKFVSWDEQKDYFTSWYRHVEEFLGIESEYKYEKS